MIRAATPCPACGAELRPEGSFCPHCGLEVRHPCPACLGTRRPLATMAPNASPWCESCDALLHRCETCGRWLLPDVLRCPDPQCGGRVLPHLPQHTGRRWDACGAGAAWSWPPEWERLNPGRRPPLVTGWTSDEPLHAAFVAHGRLYLWQGNNLLVPDPDAGWRGEDPGSGAPSIAAWRCSLGPAARPPLGRLFSERVAVLGGRAVLALERSFVQVDLLLPGDVSPLPGGTPLAQAGGPGGWAGWSEDASAPALFAARPPTGGETLMPKRVQVPLAALPATGGRIALAGSCAGWGAVDGRVWCLDLETWEARPALETSAGVPLVWCSAGGLRAAWEALGQVTAALSPPIGGRAAVTVPAGAGPLRGVFSVCGLVFVVGERIAAFDARTGDRLHEGLRPRGQWIDGAAVPAPDGEPRLLALTQEDGFAALTALRLSSGVQELLWRASGVEPRALLPVGDKLFIAHSRGVVRLVEARG